MGTVTMYIDKFEKEVLIDEDHPLAVAQRARKGAAKTPSGTTPPPPPIVTVSGKSVDELTEMRKDELAELAEKLKLVVLRADADNSKKPTVSDYIAALSQPK